MIDQKLAEKIRNYVLSDINEEVFRAAADPFWQKLKNTGTTLWLDTGDMQEAEEVWTSDMEALTTNNTLINKVIQKGIYDDYIKESAAIVSALPLSERVKEIAFILNARHGLRLVKRFGGYVSVELHTDTANDIDAILHYGLRYQAICPEKFIIKVPYTASGLIGARLLKERGVRINFTLGFGARQNVIAAHIARPDYLNVFLGRIGAYIADNKLGDGSGAGEKAVIETQRAISRIAGSYSHSTRLIAASLRSYSQLESLAGTDLYTMPPKVAMDGRKILEGKFSNKTEHDYTPGVSVDLVDSGIYKFWSVDPGLEKLAMELGADLPASGAELEDRFRDAGFYDAFPLMTTENIRHITDDGKIPVYSRWEDMIRNKKIAPDTLLNIAGLYSFTSDQGELDRRIENMIS
ncbi:MAG: transaldolase family protein [Marinilabiliaceae bacterium]|jgi:transaldolase|nr:transaldolase family protein [Marinilabiliaceae bacterium]